MNVTCSPEVERIIREHAKLLTEFRYPQAKVLILDALSACYGRSPISLDVAALLDELALHCRDLELFNEASVYLAQSLAIKNLIFGPRSPETSTARSRLEAVDSMKSGTDKLKVREEVDDLLKKVQEWTKESETAIDKGMPKLRCLVIAKDPKEMYFGDRCRSGYTVACEDGQIACLVTTAKLELGEEVEARVLQMYLGRLILRHGESPVMHRPG